MKAKNVFWGIVEAALWYYFAYTVLSFIADSSGDIRTTALRLLVTGYLAAWACPLLRNTEAWRKTF